MLFPKTHFGIIAIASILCLVVTMNQHSFAAPEWPDISSVAPDLEIPPLSEGAPAAGQRVKLKVAPYDKSALYHVLYLPTDWQPGKKYPVLVEYAGNGGYKNEFGDISTGRPEDSKLGYGLSAGRDYLWICLPCLNNADNDLALQWWGDKPDYNPQPTLDYCRAALARACRDFGGDAQRVVLCGFSRGAIACNFLGLHDDETSSLWRAFFAYSHYDGVRKWPYPGSDRAAALLRLKRLVTRPQFICSEGDYSDETRRYLNENMPDGAFTFASTGFRNHNDAWILRPCEARTRARRWLASLFSARQR